MAATGSLVQTTGNVKPIDNFEEGRHEITIETSSDAKSPQKPKAQGKTGKQHPPEVKSKTVAWTQEYILNKN